MKQLSLFTLLFIFSSNINIFSSTNFCSFFLAKKDTFLEKKGANIFRDFIRIPGTKIIAHGKRTNLFPESTWMNLVSSVIAMGRNPMSLEVDIRVTKDEKLIVFHDPTFHRIVKNYITSQEKIDEFSRKYPELARKMENRWDFHLIDEVHRYDLSEIKKLMKIHDNKNNLDFEIISVDELLQATVNEKKITVPNHVVTKNSHLISYFAGKSLEVTLDAPILFYFDFKPINHLARILYSLNDWHWIRFNWPRERLEIFTKKSIKLLSDRLEKYNAHDKIFITVRHPEMAKIVKNIDPMIHMMLSPDIISYSSSDDEFITEAEKFLTYKPELLEIKFLRHALSSKIRKWAREHSLAVMYNQIKEANTEQFEGKYKNNLKLLLDEILAVGDDIILQTNTVQRLNNYLKSRRL